MAVTNEICRPETLTLLPAAHGNLIVSVRHKIDNSPSPLPTDMANLSLHDHDGSSGASDQDTLAPLPHPGAAPWPMAFPYQYPPPPHPYNPHPGFPELGYSYGGGSASSQHSEGKSETRPAGICRGPRPPLHLHPGLASSLQAVGAVAPIEVAATGARRRTQKLGTPSQVVVAASQTTLHAAVCGGRGSGRQVSARVQRPVSTATAATIRLPAACAATTRTRAMARPECLLSTVPQC